MVYFHRLLSRLLCLSVTGLAVSGDGCRELVYCPETPVGKTGNNIIQVENFLYDALREGFDIVNLAGVAPSVHQLFDFGVGGRIRLRCDGQICAEHVREESSCVQTSACMDDGYKPECQKYFFGYACHSIKTETRLWVVQNILKAFLRHDLCDAACAQGGDHCWWGRQDALVVHLRSELCWHRDNGCGWHVKNDPNTAATLDGQEITGIPYGTPPCSYLLEVANRGNNGSAFKEVIVLAYEDNPEITHPCIITLQDSQNIAGKLTLRRKGYSKSRLNAYLEDVCIMLHADNLALMTGTFGTTLARLSSARRLYVPFSDQRKLPDVCRAQAGAVLASVENGGMSAYQVVVGAESVGRGPFDGLFHRRQIQYSFPGYTAGAPASDAIHWKYMVSYPQEKIVVEDEVVGGWYWEHLADIGVHGPSAIRPHMLHSNRSLPLSRDKTEL